MSGTRPVVVVERRGHVLVITLNRPTAMKAVNAELSGLVGEALERADADRSVRAVVLTGAGERAFCAGAVQASKRVAIGAPDSEEARWQRSDRELAAIRGTEDAREGARAFAEKRAPVWRAG